MCKCKTKKPSDFELLEEYCISCGRIWVNTLCNFFRPTDRYHPIQKPMGGVWIGHTFVKDKTGQLKKALSQ